jgi:hypothetical protein
MKKFRLLAAAFLGAALALGGAQVSAKTPAPPDKPATIESTSATPSMPMTKKDYLRTPADKMSTLVGAKIAPLDVKPADKMSTAGSPGRDKIVLFKNVDKSPDQGGLGASQKFVALIDKYQLVDLRTPTVRPVAAHELQHHATADTYMRSKMIGHGGGSGGITLAHVSASG